MKFPTMAIHVGQEPDPTTGAVIPPIYQNSTYAYMGIGENKGYQYGRSENPNRNALETCIAALENAHYGLAFASGVAAAQAVLSLLNPSDHIVSCGDLYGGTYCLFEHVMQPHKIETSYVMTNAVTDYEKAIRPNTKLIWLETLTNPLLRLVDIQAIAELAHRHKILVVVDNTFSTPYFQRPLDLGADIVVHSTTKYINGHSDVIGGMVVMNDAEIYQKIRFYQTAAGAIPGPFDSWLTLRGVKTLALRMRQHAENASAIAHFLSKHPLVEKTYYPGLVSHPDYKLATKQMNGFGGMVSFQLKGTVDDVDKVVRRFKLFTFAYSLGGVESLVSHPASMSHKGIPSEIREAYGLTDTLLRLSVGIEDIEDLLIDLDQALAYPHMGQVNHLLSLSDVMSF